MHKRCYHLYFVVPACQFHLNISGGRTLFKRQANISIFWFSDIPILPLYFFFCSTPLKHLFTSASRPLPNLVPLFSVCLSSRVMKERASVCVYMCQCVFVSPKESKCLPRHRFKLMPDCRLLLHSATGRLSASPPDPIPGTTFRQSTLSSTGGRDNQSKQHCR